MDTSETYIKMSKMAKKFLPLWEPQQGDWFSCLNPISGKGNVYIYQDLYLGSEKNEACFPLYRQDQLQEMVKPLELYAFYHWVYRTDQRDGDYLPDCNKIYTSMEQLWLAFVMKEKYNNIWNGEEWIKS